MLNAKSSSGLSKAEEGLSSRLQTMLWVSLLILALLSSLLLTNAARAQEAYSGQWLISQWLTNAKPQADKVHLKLRYRMGQSKKDGDSDFNSSTAFHIPIARLSGLTPAQITSTTGGQVRFQLVRDAGTLDCEGWFKDGQGAGHFTFKPNATFASELTKRGYGAPSSEQQFMMAIHDVDLSLVDELRLQSFQQPTLSQLVRMGTHGVRLDYVKELHGLGYRVKSVDELIRMVDHGVSLRYIRNLAALGYERLSAEQLVRAADHGVSSRYIRELKALGYDNVPVEQLIKLVDHGVSISFIEKARAAGHKDLDQMIYLHNHGIEAKKSSAQSREQEW
ncbi:MAG TPA: hypothetical protein VEW46_18755 [Pyrinomonadaceae bacterium]|nr:hypothetical protein [Pyrinomonadaceae bacterium]